MKQRKRINDNWVQRRRKKKEKNVTFTNINCIKWQEITINYVNLVCLNLVRREKNATTTSMLLVVARAKHGIRSPRTQSYRSRIDVVHPWNVSVYTFLLPNIVNRRHGTLVEFIVHHRRKNKLNRRAENGNSIFRVDEEKKKKTNENKKKV